MSNPFADFLGLIPSAPIRIARVIVHHGDGTSTVEYPDGGREIAAGESVPVNSPAYVQGGVILSTAPDLPVYEIQV